MNFTVLCNKIQNTHLVADSPPNEMAGEVKGMDKEKTPDNTEIITRTHRMSNMLYNRVVAESNKSGNAVSNEINSLILDGLRFREAKIILQLAEK